MYDDFVKRKDMKREGYSSASLHSFTNGGSTRHPLPISAGVGGGSVGGMGTLEGGVGGGSGGRITKFDKHDPRQVRVTVRQRLWKWCSVHCVLNWNQQVSLMCIYVPVGPDL